MYKIIAIAFVGVLCCILIKDIKPELTPLLLIAVGVVILILLSDTFAYIIAFFTGLSDGAGLSRSIFSSVLKIIGIGYLCEYSVNICDDCGCSSIGKKVELAGKITILTLSIPIISGIVQSIGDLL